MGNCFSSSSTIRPLNNEDENGNKVVSSSRNLKSSVRTSKSNINMSDFIGIKKSESIDNFYNIETVIGRGAFGEVVRAKHLFSNDYRAIKMIEKKKLQKHSILMKLQLSELDVLMKADHPSLLKVHEIVEDNRHYYIISELMAGGELYDRILQLKRFSERDCANILW